MAPPMQAGAMTADMGMAMDAPWALHEVAFLLWMWAVMMVA